MMAFTAWNCGARIKYSVTTSKQKYFFAAFAPAKA